MEKLALQVKILLFFDTIQDGEEGQGGGGGESQGHTSPKLLNFKQQHPSKKNLFFGQILIKLRL